MEKTRVPHTLLQSIVQSFWTIDTHNNTTDKVIQVLPDGCFDIVIYITKKNRNEVVLTGIWDKPIEVTIPNNLFIAGARLYPACKDILLTIDLSTTKNIHIPLTQNMIRGIDDISFDLLFTSNTPDEIFDFLEAYLCLLIKSRSEEPNPILDRIRHSNHSKSVKTISKEIGISDRHLTRKFNQLFGIKTKTYLNILRFIKAKELLLSNKNISIIDIALECGYYDQAHLSNEFKKYSGMTPKQYLLKDV